MTKMDWQNWYSIFYIHERGGFERYFKCFMWRSSHLTKINRRTEGAKGSERDIISAKSLISCGYLVNTTKPYLLADVITLISRECNKKKLSIRFHNVDVLILSIFHFFFWCLIISISMSHSNSILPMIDEPTRSQLVDVNFFFHME